MIKVFPNFLTLNECSQLNEITLLGISEGWVKPGHSRGYYNYQKRFTSRMHMIGVKYPNFVIEISNKIRKFLNLQNYPIIDNHGSSGVVTSITFPGGDVYSHKDPKSITGYSSYRCNVMTQKPEGGGKLYVDNEVIPINVGDLHCYYASEQIHYVTEVVGNIPRILWMFGAYLPQEKFILEKNL